MDYKVICPTCDCENTIHVIDCVNCGVDINDVDLTPVTFSAHWNETSIVIKLLIIPALIFLIYFGFRAVSYDYGSPPTNDPIKALSSEWNGSNPEMESMVKSKMKDSSSYEHVETGYRKNDDGTVTIRMKYKGKNSFNATITGSAVGTIDPDTRALTKFSMF